MFSCGQPRLCQVLSCSDSGVFASRPPDCSRGARRPAHHAPRHRTREVAGDGRRPPRGGRRRGARSRRRASKQPRRPLGGQPAAGARGAHGGPRQVWEKGVGINGVGARARAAASRERAARRGREPHAPKQMRTNHKKSGASTGACARCCNARGGLRNKGALHATKCATEPPCVERRECSVPHVALRHRFGCFWRAAAARRAHHAWGALCRAHMHPNVYA